MEARTEYDPFRIEVYREDEVLFTVFPVSRNEWELRSDGDRRLVAVIESDHDVDDRVAAIGFEGLCVRRATHIQRRIEVAEVLADQLDSCHGYSPDEILCELIAVRMRRGTGNGPDLRVCTPWEDCDDSYRFFASHDRLALSAGEVLFRDGVASAVLGDSLIMGPNGQPLVSWTSVLGDGLSGREARDLVDRALVKRGVILA